MVGQRWVDPAFSAGRLYHQNAADLAQADNDALDNVVSQVQHLQCRRGVVLPSRDLAIVYTFE